MIAFENLFKKKSFNIKVLEFGAGWGFWSRLAQSLNFKVNVSEISTTRNKFLKDNNFKYTIKNITSINFTMKDIREKMKEYKKQGLFDSDYSDYLKGKMLWGMVTKKR